ncbi:MAG: hypothetical protein ACR2P6_08210 [Gammaproteobacteria bacterium]
MQRIVSLTSIALLATTAVFSTAFAQQERDAVEVVLAQIQANRQAVVAENLILTPEEGEAFWPLYREYRAELAQFSDQRIALIKKFADNYDDLSDTMAQEVLDDYFSAEKDRNKVREKYVKQFRKVLGETKTLRFYQIENKLDSIINYDLSLSIPLAR